MSDLVEDLLRRLKALPPEDKASLSELVQKQTAGQLWFPLPGPQSDAYYSEADEVYYGGSAGGGKTDLCLGLSLTAHKKSLGLRRFNKDARGLYNRCGDILGYPKDSGNKQLLEWEVQGRRVVFGGCQYEDDKERYKGEPYDLIFFDEIPDFTQSQFVFIKTWNRTVDPEQRCRVVVAGNPPTKPEGRWVIEYWAPWLDPKHPRPAKCGELRWFVQAPEEDNLGDVEVEKPGLYLFKGGEVHYLGQRKKDTIPEADRKFCVIAKSRTFIRAMLKDNPYLMATDYEATLDAMPAALRAAYRDGRFDIALEDQANQLIPTAWVLEAVERSRNMKMPPQGIPMCNIGCDVAQGGKDEAILAPRYDGYFPPLISIPGADVPRGRDLAARILSERRDRADVSIDMGGGYGSSVSEVLEENDVNVFKFKGAETATGRAKDGTRFVNRRTEALWRFREALDPDQPGGSHIILPDDNKLVADLTAPTFDLTSSGYVAEPKKNIKKRLGRSPDRGDAVIISWLYGPKMLHYAGGDMSKAARPKRPECVGGHANRHSFLSHRRKADG